MTLSNTLKVQLLLKTAYNTDMVYKNRPEWHRFTAVFSETLLINTNIKYIQHYNNNRTIVYGIRKHECIKLQFFLLCKKIKKLFIICNQ